MSRNILIVTFVLALTFGVFVRTMNHDFIIWDDDKNIYQNRYISQYHLEGIKRYWEGPFIGLYIPVTYTVWSLIAYDAGKRVNFGAGSDPIIDATRFHLATVLLHTGSVALVMLLFYRLLGRRDVFAAAIGASLFALHPLQVEPVAWATGLKDTLSGFLALICVLLYISYSRLLRREKPGRAWCLYTGAFLLYVIALLAKPQLVIIPPIIAILLWSKEEHGLVPGALPKGPAEKRKPGWDHWDDLMALGILAVVCVRVVLLWDTSSFYPVLTAFNPLIDLPLIACIALLSLVLYLRRETKKIRTPSFFGDLVWLTPFLMAAFTFAIITIRSQPEQDAIFAFDRPPVYMRPFIALDALGFYISKLFYPFKLGVDYGRNPTRAIELARQFPVWIVPLLAAAFLLRRIKSHHRLYLAAFAVAFVAIAPVLGLIPFGFQGQSTVADRYCYLPLIGLGLAVATFLTFTENSLPRYLAAAILPFMALISFNQVAKWKNSETLFQYALTVNPKSVASTYNLGLTYSKEKQYERALDYYHRAIALKDDFSHPWNNIGYILNSLQRYAEAIYYLEKAVEVNPEFDGSYSNLGIAYDHLGEFDKAIDCYNQALERYPGSISVITNMGLAYMGKGDWESAIRHFKRASRMDPNIYQPYSGLGDVYIKTKNYPAAIDAYTNLVTLQPGNPRFLRALAYAYGYNGQFDQAARHMKTSLDMIRNEPAASEEVKRLFERDYENFRSGKMEAPQEEPASPSPKENPSA